MRVILHQPDIRYQPRRRQADNHKWVMKRVVNVIRAGEKGIHGIGKRPSSSSPPPASSSCQKNRKEGEKLLEPTVLDRADMAEKKEKEEEIKEEDEGEESPPEKPLPGDCCGSGCVRCVWDVYYDELEEYNNRQQQKKDVLLSGSGGGKDDSSKPKSKFPSSDSPPPPSSS
ncbi:hypothetical protein MRB53_006886 [Persea americana]|uniref:Uncharacterized protein n=1 Tax=Persea americana TaxID=3435 RepID=A0ACC2MHY1_PERAE|nr:hypothetical protein MRB53_006886 [Persea americana]|eukprot:TRINITY_DN7123_c1_g1_i1.p1 TRINITY_DN7123_c1_g1~~TRINITY_DN7123_c1_g1_i1.p1  ORF type:complete len:171 (-),score=45.41 TRINITY_DN7123_c1_g1_i1:293-805(-)